MSKTFVIQWKSKVNGRAGRGTKHFEKEEGERLVAELNHEYPQIEHEILEVHPRPAMEEPSVPAGTTTMLSIA